MISLKNALAWTGHYPAIKAHKNDPTLDEDLIWGLRRFQRDFTLTQDGISRPGGEDDYNLFLRNCQDYADAVEREYYRLKRQQIVGPGVHTKPSGGMSIAK